MSKNLIIIGSGGHAKVVVDIFEKMGSYKIVGLIDRFKNPGDKVMDYAILGAETDLPSLVALHAPCDIFVAIGDNFVRGQVVSNVRSLLPAVVFAKAIHPSAQIARGVSIGAGSTVMAGCVVNTDTSIGEHVIVNTSASIDHDCRLEDYSSVAPGAVLGGTVILGAYSAVSIGAAVRHRITIGEHSVVGAGTVVLKDLPDGVVAYGTPAREVRKRVPGDRYL